MAEQDLSLIAHLLRRAGFGSSRDELEQYATRDYHMIVEELLDPECSSGIDEDIFRRYHLGVTHEEHVGSHNGRWFYRMINSKRPLEEKVALFWHGVFATGWDKGEHSPSSILQIETFRRFGMANLQTILLELSKDPAMIYWLDNSENHRDEPNENYGRELMELFSMGVGNYSEQDIKAAARAFTGWTFEQPIPLYPYGHYPARFVYRAEDHDDGVKTYLGETGRLNGDDVIEIIVRQPATARFIARRLYNFFVADEPQVPAWPHVPPADPDAIETLVRAYEESGAEMRSILRVLFNSDFFKEARFKKVKSPVELVAGTIKLTGTHRQPEPDLPRFADAAGLMGQRLLNPPTVEGWHTGPEWIDGGTLTERINFAVNEVGDAGKPGIRRILEELAGEPAPLSPQGAVNCCLDLVGPLSVSDETRAALVRFAEADGDFHFESEEERAASTARALRLLQLIVASREYQFA